MLWFNAEHAKTEMFIIYVFPVPSLWARANKLSSPSVPGLGGCGDEPHAAFASHVPDGNSGVGKIAELSVSSADDDDDDFDEEDEHMQELIQVIIH